MPTGTYYVYILASLSKVLYIGMTNDLERRLYEHRNGTVKGFTSQYKVNRLVHLEIFSTPRAAIDREKVLKGWNRKKKIALIEETNPAWDDISNAWRADNERPEDLPDLL